MSANIRKEILRSELNGTRAGSSTQASITAVQQLSSYNWVNDQDATIVVPGCPPKWRECTTPRQLEKDSGHVFINQNAARHPSSPLEPMFRALYSEHPNFDIKSIDLVTDRNNLRKLMTFIGGQGSDRGVESFQIDVEVQGETVLLGRKEVRDSEYIGPTEFRGYGREFEKAYTQNVIQSSTGHHRIIQYRFGGLDLLVRYEADGCVGADSPSLQENYAQTDILSELMGSIAIQDTTEDLTVRRRGQQVPIDAILEIKTRVHHKYIHFDDVAPQLWLSQTSKLVRAYHNRGVFKVPVVEDVASTLQKWEAIHQDTLKSLTVLLQTIIQTAKAYGTATINYQPSSDTLIIQKSHLQPMLPTDLCEKWNSDFTTKSLDQVIEPRSDSVVTLDETSTKADSTIQGSKTAIHT